MKYTVCLHKLFVSKITSVLLFILLPLFIYAENNNKKLEILTTTLNNVKKEKKEDTQTKKIIATLDSVIRLKKVSDNDFAKVTFRISELFREQGTLTSAIELFFNVTSYYELSGKKTKEKQETLVGFYIPLGALHEELGMWNRAMDYYLKALKIAEDCNSDYHKALVYNNIGAIYLSQTKSDKAEVYLKKALKINLKNDNKKELFNNYNNLAGIYFNKKQYDQALSYSLKALQTLDEKNDPYQYYFIQANIATLYLQKKDYKLAVSYLRSAMEHQERFHFAYDLIETYLMFSRIYSNMNQHDSAQFYIDRTLNQIEVVQNRYLESRMLQTIAEYYGGVNNFEKAYKALKKSTWLKDSIQEIDNLKKIDNLEKVYDADKKIKENELLSKEISLRETASDRLWIIVFTVALLLIIAVLFLISSMKSKKKIRKVNEMLLKQKDTLFKQENELQKQKEQELNDTIDQRNRELTSHTLHMIKNNEFISDLAEELKKLLLELKPQDRLHKEHLRQILNNLLRQNHTTADWEEFSFYFEQVHPSFYDNLGNDYPDLTMKEKRLCAFLRLGLSTKEISAITFKEVRSVETARNRLRKKLNLSSDENLAEFLCHNNSLNNPTENKDESD